MHSVFLQLAIPKGLNMSIVNPGGLPRYQDIDENTRKLLEEVILNKSADGNHVERVLQFAQDVKEAKDKPPSRAALCDIKKSSATEQKAWLTSIKEDVVCTAEHITPE